MTTAVCARHQTTRSTIIKWRLREIWLDFRILIEVLLDAWLELEEKPGPRPIYPAPEGKRK